MRLPNAFGLASLVVVLGIGGGLGAHRILPESPLVRGLSIENRPLPERVRETASWLEALRKATGSRSLRFYDGELIFRTTFADAGVTVDVEATLGEALAIGHRGSLWRRLREAEKARRGEIDVPFSWSFDRAKARRLLESYAPMVAREPIDARLDLERHWKIPAVSGKALDIDATLTLLESSSHEEDEAIALVTKEVPARIGIEELSRVNIEKVVSAFETTFVTFGPGARRAINIRNAAAKMDGMVLGPYEVFSFNEKVGPRTRERGFVLAPEIQGDELQDGYGGGTCQVSSTLYAAALFGAMEIVERQPHSRPSSYTKLGLDATVSYPLTDLKIRNRMPYPVMIHAYLPRSKAVRVEILGGEPLARVEYSYGVVSSEGFFRRVVVKPALSPGVRVRHQKGIPGYEVVSTIKTTFLDGRVEERRSYSGYRPTPEIYWVAPGYDMAELPPLPEQAKGVEGVSSSGQETRSSEERHDGLDG